MTETVPYVEQPYAHGKLTTRAAVATVVLIGLFGWLGMKVIMPDILPVKKFQLEGTFAHVSAEQLSQVIAPNVTGGFFNINVYSVEKAAEQLPWVRSVSVRRIWPDTLHVRVIEQQPMARWSGGGLINSRGEIFHPTQNGLTEELPVLTGPKGSLDLVVGQYQKMHDQLADIKQKVVALELDQRHAWRAELSNGIELVLGRAPGDGELKRFVKIYEKNLVDKAGKIRQVDLRYTNGFAVQWKAKDNQEPGQGRKLG